MTVSSWNNLKTVGLRTAGSMALRRLLGRVTLPWFSELSPAIIGKTALEIGGPSKVFRKRDLLPIYPLIGRCDDVDFASTTIWRPGPKSRNELTSGDVQIPKLMEATSLDKIPAGSYDIVLCSHVLEHTANPLQALEEWNRVLVPGGFLFLIVPDKNRTFDHRRQVTTLDHIKDDYNARRGEADMTHLGEVLKLHDLSRDPAAGDMKNFEKRCRRNAEVRGMHHHVFNLRSLCELVECSGFDIVRQAEADPFHLVVVARRCAVPH